MFDWMKRRIQPLQAQEKFGFQYQGTTDSSRYSEEEISNEEVFSRIQRLLKNVKDVPVIPDTFSAANPPKQVYTEVVEISCRVLCLSKILKRICLSVGGRGTF